MPQKSISKSADTDMQVTDLLRDLMIIELAREGVPGADIRKVLSCDMNKVTRIIKALRKGRRKNTAS